jgi:hypothetical protein
VVRFSISTPIGSYHPLLPQCLASLRAQSASMSVALLDASSDRRVARLADEYGDVIRYRRHGPDAGQAAAIREGWAHTDGEVLGWLNADDLLFPDALVAAARVFESDPAIDVVYGHSAICDQDMRFTGYHWAVSPPGDALRLGCNISQPSCFFRRRVTEAVGGLDGSLHYTMDWDLWLRLDAHGARFSFLDAPLSAVFWGAGTKTSGFNAMRRKELSRLIDRYTPAASRAKVFRGFSVQAALDRLQPLALRRLARETLFPNKQRVFGVGPDGRLDETATVHWFHLAPTPKRGVRLVVGGEGPLHVDTSVSSEPVDVSGGDISVRFDEPVPSATVVRVSVRTPTRRLRRLRSCAFTD